MIFFYVLYELSENNSSKFLLQIHLQSVHRYSPLNFVDVLRGCGAAGIVHPPVGIAHVLSALSAHRNASVGSTKGIAGDLLCTWNSK